MSQKTKEIQLSPNISPNDINYRIYQAIHFLEKGNKVKLHLKFRGREIKHPYIGMDVVNLFILKTKDYAVVESPAKLVGKNIFCIIRPKSKKG